MFTHMRAVKYNRHAKKRMKDRDVSEDEVLFVIKNPDSCEPSIKGRINAFKFIRGRHIRVTFKEESVHILVITVTIRKKPFQG